MERLSCVKQLVFSRTRLEFRLIWNKIFQKEDEEVNWLLNPYKAREDGFEATPMTTFSRNFDSSSTYQYGYDDVKSALGRDRVTSFHRGIVKKSLKQKKKKQPTTYTERAIQIARYMGMGVYMTSTAFPSPMLPFNENHIFNEDNFYTSQHGQYLMTRYW